MSPRNGLRRALSALTGALLVLPALVAVQAVEVAQAPPAAAAAPTDQQLRALEQQVAQAINAARTDPGQMSANLLAAERVDTDHVKLASGAQFQVNDSFLKTSAAEAASQPALPALGWSEKLAQNARAYVYAQNRRGSWSLGHDSSYSGFPYRAAPPLGIEAIGNGDPADANTFVYRWWTSMNEWTVGSAWKPNSSFTGDVGRGHRGIVNDQRYNAIGVGCGSPFPYSGTTYVACIVQDGTMTDATPLAPVDANGKPALDGLKNGTTGTLGTTTVPGQTSLTVDTAATATPTPTSTDAAQPGVATPGTTAAADDGTAGATGDLVQGQTWDVYGDGSFTITVKAQDLFTPSDRATIEEFGTKATKYRGFEVTYENASDSPVHLPDVAKSWACLDSGDHQMPFVIDPPGQGLPADEDLGRGRAVFAFGCGVGDDGTAKVGIDGGSAIGGGRQWWLPATSAAPSASGTTAAAGSACPNSDTTYGAQDATLAAAALRCLINEQRATQGLAPMLESSQLDSDATAVANLQRRQFPNGSACRAGGSGKVTASTIPNGVGAKTAREAFTLLGGLKTYSQAAPVYLGTGAGFPPDQGGTPLLQWDAVTVTCA